MGEDFFLRSCMQFREGSAGSFLACKFRSKASEVSNEHILRGIERMLVFFRERRVTKRRACYKIHPELFL